MTNRSKGHNAERYYVSRFKELGFDKCRTSREASRLLDDCAVDLVFLPVLVQIKAGSQKGLNASQVLRTMEERLKAEFPEDAPEQTMPRLMIHYKGVGTGRKRTEYDEIVTMTFETFTRFLKAYNNDLQSNKRTNPTVL